MTRRQKTDREYLEFQSDRLEAVLSLHNVPSRVHGGDVMSRSVRFNVATPANARIAKLRNLSEEIAMALGVKEVRVTREGSQLAIEMPRPDPEPVHLLGMLQALDRVPMLTASLGLASNGRPLLLRLSSPDVAHVLVAGTTGSGKTELLRTLAMSLALTNRQRSLQMLLIDMKARGLAPLASLPHLLTGPLTTLEYVEPWLAHMVAEMEARDAQQRNTPAIVIVIDEVIDLLMTGGKSIAEALVRLAQRGREAGIHLVLGAQKPSAKAFDSQLKANLPVRLVGRMTSASDALVAAGVAGSGAEKLMGRGDFVAVAAGQTTRFQAAYIPVHDWANCYERLGVQMPATETR